MEISELAAKTIEAEDLLKKSLKGRLRDTIASDLLHLGILVTVCTCVALLLNELREQPLPLMYASKQARMEQATDEKFDLRPDETAPTTSAEGSQIISLVNFQSLVRSKHGVILDARSEIFHRLGHVPGAVSLSREKFDQDYAKKRSFLESRLNEPIAVYCSSATCEDSQIVAADLIKLGYRHVSVFKGGWEEWTQAGLTEERQ